MDSLQDNYGRSFCYLRLSLTDACNFRCQYCLPNGYQPQPRCGDPREDTALAIDEIENLVCGFAQLGFKKVRLTGGEPTLRPDIIEIVQRIAALEGIETVALTTNGYRLDKIAAPLHAAGLNALNISLDSLDPERFLQITGSKRFARVHHGMLQALRVGIKQVKINAVLLRSFIEKDLEAFFALVSETPICLRFIELMETGGNGEFYRAEHLSGDNFRAFLEARGWSKLSRSVLDGPAQEFAHPDYSGRLGIIAPYSRDFCANCNRLRVSSRGKLKLCLFGDGELPLRGLLQSSDQRAQLVQTVRALISGKAASHHLHQGVFGSTQNLAAIGG